MNEILIDKLNGLFKAFRQKDATIDGTLDIYLDRLGTLPTELVCAAIDRLIDTSRFLPTIAEIKEAAVHGPFGANLAEEAWIEVQREARRVGFNRPRVFMGGRFLDPEEPHFSTPTIAAAAASMGWELICNGDNAKGFIRDQFIKSYRAVAEKETKAKQTGLLPMTTPQLEGGVG